MSLLEVRDVTMRFGGLTALKQVSLVADQGILGLIGPNGAGKTTLFNCISGFLRPTEGEVLFQGQAIHRRRPHQIVALGIARTFQIVKPFSDLTVEENVLSGLGKPIYPRLHAFWQRTDGPEARARVQGLLERVGLLPWAKVKASSLPIGLQRRLEIARALATEPRLLLLDEPAAGLTSGEAESLAALVRQLAEEGMAIILIEHNMRFAMNLCHRLVVLNRGEILAEGRPEEIQRNEAVIDAYLGRVRTEGEGG